MVISEEKVHHSYQQSWTEWFQFDLANPLYQNTVGICGYYNDDDVEDFMTHDGLPMLPTADNAAATTALMTEWEIDR